MQFGFHLVTLKHKRIKQVCLYSFKRIMFGVAYMLVLYSYFNKSRNDSTYYFAVIELVLNLSVLCFVMKSYKTYVSVIYVINEERFFSKAKKEDLVPMDEIISTLRYYIITLRKLVCTEQRFFAKNISKTLYNIAGNIIRDIIT